MSTVLSQQLLDDLVKYRQVFDVACRLSDAIPSTPNLKAALDAAKLFTSVLDATLARTLRVQPWPRPAV